jgi:proline iminopeptidase
VNIVKQRKGTYLSLLLLLTSSIFAQPIKLTSGLVHTPDVDLFFEVHGDLSPSTGTPIIFANGGPGFPLQITSRSKAWGIISKKWPIVFYDQRGLGSSHLLNPNAPQSIQAQISDVEALRQALGVERIIIAGHSWGGNIAMGYAEAFPQHVTKMILVDSAGPHWHEEGGSTLESFFPDVVEQSRLANKGDNDPKHQDEEYSRHLSMMFYGEESRRRFETAAKGIRLNQTIYEANAESMKREDQWPQLQSLRIPTLVLTGRFDVNIPPLTAWKIHKAIRDSTFIALPKSGHFPFVEEPETFARLVTNFLRAQPVITPAR